MIIDQELTLNIMLLFSVIMTCGNVTRWQIDIMYLDCVPVTMDKCKMDATTDKRMDHLHRESSNISQ